MNYNDAMTQMKQGRAVKRPGWAGHARVEGLRVIRVKPNVRPVKFCATEADRAATDWVASVPPARSDVSADIATFTDSPKGPVNHGSNEAGGAVDGSGARG